MEKMVLSPSPRRAPQTDPSSWISLKIIIFYHGARNLEFQLQPIPLLLPNTMNDWAAEIFASTIFMIVFFSSDSLLHNHWQPLSP